MDKDELVATKLLAALEVEIEKEGRSLDEKIFLKLLRSIWQVNCMIPAGNIWLCARQGNIASLGCFEMAGNMDKELGTQLEQQLIHDFEAWRVVLNPHLHDNNWQQKFMPLVKDITSLVKNITYGV
ncbi:hypothetical protein QUA13_29110 [Microcoleus sp. S28C3]|uniref:hypothetical protein n=1 Tax=Microcoleus sp. S28C3 TaxID=3055414 RepID=UPI002FD43761